MNEALDVSYISKVLDIEGAKVIQTIEGHQIKVYEFLDFEGEELFSAWAKHFRNHYCKDDEIDDLRHGIGITRQEYLSDYCFPDEKSAPGPSIRAGDFGEILIADFLEFTYEYWVPRLRYDEKAHRNLSTQGSDVLGFKILDAENDSPDDILIVYEVKAKLSGNRPTTTLQTAIDHSKKDIMRIGYGLNAYKRRLFRQGDRSDASKISRFQSKADRPFKMKFGAASVQVDKTFDESTLREASVVEHPEKINLELITIKGTNLMNLVHTLYQLAADEA